MFTCSRGLSGHGGPVVETERLGPGVGAHPGRGRTRTRCASPSNGRSALRSILRRCAKPARTSVNSASVDGTSTGGAARRSSRTSADSTLGAGTNTVAANGTHHAGGCVVRHLHGHGTVGPAARAGGEPLAHLALHHNRADASRGDKSSSSRTTTGVATLYGRFDTQCQFVPGRPNRRRARGVRPSRRSGRRRGRRSTSPAPSSAASSTGRR